MALEIKRGSQWWYGRLSVEGQSKCFNLQVRVAGAPPESLKDRGDASFERSRLAAQIAHDKLRESIRNRSVLRDYAEKLTEANRMPIGGLVEFWESMPGVRRCARYSQQCKKILETFVSHVGKECAGLESVSPADLRSFLQTVSEAGATARTYNRHVTLLRSVFRAVHRDGRTFSDPSVSLQPMRDRPVHRRPFQPDEIRRLLEATDSFLRPLVITAICTAMRRGDCCSLKWENVDLESGFLRCETAKTGESVEIPIFPMLRKLLEKRRRTNSPYVFPAQAAMQHHNPNGLTYRLRQALTAAGVADRSQSRTHGIRRASLIDWHSFRTTWITLALTAGVPMEIVRRVTGHQSVDLVLRHYFRPDREQFRAALTTKLPQFLLEGKPDKLSVAREIAKKMRVKTFYADRKRLLKALE